MDIYELKFTALQSKIIRLMCAEVGNQLNQRTMAKFLKVTPTAIAKALKGLENIVKVEKSKTMNLNTVELNRNNPEVFQIKRIENLKMAYDSGLPDFLEDQFPGATIILFGSYSYGEDTVNSDIDIAVIGVKEKKLNVRKY